VVKVTKSLKAHLKGILAHYRHKLSTSFLEGINNKIKVIKQVAFDYRELEYFFLKIRAAFLCATLT
jgi:transposase